MIIQMPGSREFSPPKHQGHQGNPLFPECRAAINQEFLDFVGQGDPISEEATGWKSFVLSWCTWCLGGSCSEFGRGLGLGMLAKQSVQGVTP
jgi:hypothetical protein